MLKLGLMLRHNTLVPDHALMYREVLQRGLLTSLATNDFNFPSLMA